MREILFRGKSIEDNKWVYGFVDNTTVCGANGNYIATIINEKAEEPFTGEWYEIDPKTVGPYTGLKDKNGTKIFEGDICNFSNRSDIDNYGVVVYDADETEFGIDYGSTYLGLGRHYHPRDVEVIGNIYDNPELLEE